MKLSQYCARQTKAGNNEKMCDCWMAPATYRRVLQDQAEALGKESEVVQQVNAKLDAYKMKDYCWGRAGTPGAHPQPTSPARKRSRGLGPRPPRAPFGRASVRRGGPVATD